MPELKAFIEINGQKIIEKNLDISKHIFEEICIVTNQPELYSHLGVPLLGDIYDSRAPMNGILTSLLNSSSKWVFISACDMPFINRHLIEYMAKKRNNLYAVVPRKGGRPEPLFAFYSIRCFSAMEKSFLSGEKSLHTFLHKHSKRVQYISSKEIKKIDPEFSSFINLNTPADVDFYRQREGYY